MNSFFGNAFSKFYILVRELENYYCKNQQIDLNHEHEFELKVIIKAAEFMLSEQSPDISICQASTQLQF